ncbi:sigma-70 family RNA polymerase sigma factor [Alkalihalobacillus sp. FSL W8-0930]
MELVNQRAYKESIEVREFVATYEKALNAPVIRAFLEEEQHMNLLIESIVEPTPKNREAVNESFRSFYMELRLVKYLSQLIHYYSIDVSKRYRRHFARHSYVMDQPLSDDHSLYLHDVLESEGPSVESLVTEGGSDLEQVIENPLLYKHFLALSDKQKQVLNLYFVGGLSHRVIAKRFGSTPQNISQIATRALAKLRSAINQEDKHE